MMFLDCPAFLDHGLTARCGLPAEVRCRFTMRSSDGLLECAMIRCPVGHYFNAPIEFLTWNGNGYRDPSATAADAPDGRDGQGSREGSRRSTARDYRAEPMSAISRLCTAPAYYQGRPAQLWITAMRPRRRTTCDQRTQAVSDGGPPAPPRHAEQVTSGRNRRPRV